jgi:DNA-binding LacI/PurR family transcriptional regulator
MSRRPGSSIKLSYVDAAQRAGGALAAERLVQRGCRRVATITGPLDMPAARERLAGFLEAMAMAGQASVPAVEGNFTHESGESAMARLLDENPDIDGVFAANDLMAHGALLVLHDRGRAVPEDVAVVGFDDSHTAVAARPPLTTIRQPLEEMAGEMAKLLLARIDEPNREANSVIFEPTLVVRESA